MPHLTMQKIRGKQYQKFQSKPSSDEIQGINSRIPRSSALVGGRVETEELISREMTSLMGLSGYAEISPKTGL